MKQRGKLKIAFVVSWYRHNGPGAVAHQDIIGDPDRNFGAIDRIDRHRSQVHTRLRALNIATLDVATPPTLFHIPLHCRLTLWSTEDVHERVLWRQDHIGRPKQRIRSRRKDAQLVLASIARRHGYKSNRRALAAANPVGLHGLHFLWPLKLIEVA